MGHFERAIALASALIVLVFAAEASGAQRYASPGVAAPAGSCVLADPCSLQEAVEDASVNDGDEVIVLAGSYLESDEVTLNDAITVRGEPGASPPEIDTTAPSGVALNNAGAVVRNLAINQTGGLNALLIRRGTAERIRASSTTLAVACEVGSLDASALLRDSTCLNTEPGGAGTAIHTGGAPGFTFPARLRNVSAYAFGANSIGIDVDAGFDDVVVDARNVIASGGSFDVRADGSGSSTATVALQSSNYLTVDEDPVDASITDPGTGGNQTAEPQLLSPAGGDFTQLPGSPTIDAGTVDSLVGPVDVGGNPRSQGPSPDIGAHEATDVVPPNTTITSGPTGPTREGRPTFAFTSTEAGSTFACRVDTEQYEACSSPYKTESLTQGPHTFQVRATDAASNTDPTPAERSFVVDKTVSGANAKAKRSQKQGRKVVLEVVVSATENVRVGAKGSVDAGKNNLALVARDLTSTDGAKRTLSLKPKKSSSNRKIRRLLKRGERPTATVNATFTDDLGNKATSGIVSIKLKAKRR